MGPNHQYRILCVRVLIVKFLEIKNKLVFPSRLDYDIKEQQYTIVSHRFKRKNLLLCPHLQKCRFQSIPQHMWNSCPITT